MKFYEEIECEHGWTDKLGWAICDLGSGCSIDFQCFCTKEACPIYEEEELTHCPICKREVPEDCWEHHHLIPRSMKGKETIHVCVSCGDQIHKLLSLKELRSTYNTPEAICSHPEIRKWVAWVSKKPTDFSICMRGKKKRN